MTMMQAVMKMMLSPMVVLLMLLLWLGDQETQIAFFRSDRFPTLVVGRPLDHGICINEHDGISRTSQTSVCPLAKFLIHRSVLLNPDSRFPNFTFFSYF